MIRTEHIFQTQKCPLPAITVIDPSKKKTGISPVSYLFIIIAWDVHYDLRSPALIAAAVKITSVEEFNAVSVES